MIIKKRFILFSILIASLSGITEGKTFIVDNTKDDTKQGSLRWALTEGNKDTDAETKIHFSFPTVDSKGKKISTVIYINDPLPDLTKKMTIDGLANGMGTANSNTSMLGANNANLHIIIESNDKRVYDGFRILKGASGSTIQGLIINKFKAGITLYQATSAIINNNFIGSKDRGNQLGIYAEQASNININNNIIDFNNDYGAQIINSHTLTLSANYIGITYNGGDAGNGLDGLNIIGSYNISIGNYDNNIGNIISGNGRRGISIHDCDACSIKGNYIGVSIGGMMKTANNAEGIWLQDTTDLKINNNLISGNGNSGIYILEEKTTSPTDCTITRNCIGLGSDGTTAVGNGHSGIYLNYASGIIIGDTDGSKKNLISGNGSNGISIVGAPKNNKANKILSNYIGTNKDGSLPTSSNGGSVGFSNGNAGNGIWIKDSRLVDIQHNLISGNGASGIRTEGGCDSSSILNNIIGLNLGGTKAYPNVGDGIRFCGTKFVLVDTSNVISGNNKNGIRFTSYNQEHENNINKWSTDNTVINNTIGYNAAETASIKNGESAIWYERGATSTNNTVPVNEPDNINSNTVSGTVTEKG